MRRGIAAAAVLCVCAAGVVRAGTPEDEELERQTAAIEQLYNAAQPGLHRCWEKAAADDFRVAGKLVLRLTAGKAGKVGKVEVVSDDAGDAGLTACVVALTTAWNLGDSFPEGEGVELPFVFVAGDAKYTLREEDAPVRKTKGQKGEARILVDRESLGAEKAALVVYSLPHKASLPLRRMPGAMLVSVLEGKVRVRGLGDKQGVELGPGDAAYVAAGTASAWQATCCKKSPARLLVLYAPGGAERPLKDASVDAGIVLVGKAEQKKPAADAPQPRTALVAGAEELSVGGGKGHVKILFDAASAGDGAAYLGVVRFDAGASVPEHVHADEAEILYITGGDGEMTIDGIVIPVAAGMAVHVPPGKKHAFRTGGGLSAVQFYAPSGPEQRFRKPAK